MLQAQDNRNIDLYQYWQIFWRRKFFFIIPFLAGAIAGIVLIFITKPVYQSSTVVQINQGQLLSRDMQQIVPGFSAQERLTNLRKLITSHAYLIRLIESLNLYTDPVIRSRAEENKNKYPGLTTNEIVELLWIDQLKRFLSIQQQGTDFIQITAAGNTAEMAYNFAKTLTQIFIDESLRNEVGGIRGALEFGSEQLALYKQKLEESEEKYRQHKEGMVRDEIENERVMTSNIDQVNAILTTTNFELREAKDRLNFLQSQLQKSNINYKSLNNSELNKMKSELANSILELSKLMLEYSWQDAKILRINSDIDLLREAVRREIEKEVKSKYDSNVDLFIEKEITSVEVEILNKKREVFSNLINMYNRSQSSGPSQELTMARLQREVDVNKEIYQSLIRQTRGSEIEEALQRTSAEFKFKVIEPAIRPLKPITPNRVKLIFMACAVGSIFGIGMIALLEYTDHSFKNVEDVEKYLNLPVLGTMSKIELDIYSKIKSDHAKF